MHAFDFVFYLLAGICFLVSAFGREPINRVGVLPLGLLFFVIPFIFHAAQAAF